MFWDFFANLDTTLNSSTLQQNIMHELSLVSNKTTYACMSVTCSYTFLKNNETTCSAPWPTVMRGYFTRNSSPAFCMLLTPSKNTRSTTSVHLRLCSSTSPSKLAMSGLMTVAMCDASYFPPLARWSVQSTMLRSANKLLTPAANTFRSGMVLMVAPSPKVVMPNMVASLSRVFICSLQLI